MAKMTQSTRKMILGWLGNVVQELVDARRDDEGKSGHPAVRDLLDAYAYVRSYEITNVMWLENVTLGYRGGFIIDTHNGGWVGYYYEGHYDERGYRDKDPEMVKMPLPRKYNTAICNAIKLFASDQWQYTVAKYGVNL